MGAVKHYIHVCYLVSFLVFKSAKATAPVLLTKWDDTVSSPNYPFTYPTNTTLTWIKTVSSGNRITITINDFQTQCEGDYLEIRDGDSVASPLLAKFCGRSGAGQSVSSSGTQMLLRFVSDNVTDSLNTRGFNLRHSGVCKVQTNATSGVITTPQYPEDYPNYMDCLWTIKLHPSMLIALECHDIALEYEEDCRFDYMEILAGVSLDDAPVLGRFCGIYNHSLTFERDGNISIRFASDADKELSGFRCAYNVDKVRGDWTEWTTWTECSQTCHHGNQTRYRTCLNPLPESELELVCGHVADNETRTCLISNCIPIDGGYSSWSNWSACNVSCGTGFRNRSRSCTNPPPAFTGKNCSEIGVPWETTECALAPCPGSASVVSISSPTSHFSPSTYVMLQSFLTVTSSHDSSVQQLATTSSSYSSVAISPSNSGAVPFLGDSRATPYSKFSLSTPLTRSSSTLSSQRNILSASSTKNLQNRMTSDVQGVHMKTSYSTLDELHTSNKSILNDRTVISVSVSSSNIYSTDEIWKIATSYYSYSSKPWRLSTEPLTLKSKLFGDSISTVGQPGQQNVEISKASFLSQTKFKSFNSQKDSTAFISKISSSYPTNSSITWHVFTEPLTSKSNLLKDSISTVALTRYHVIRVSSTSIHVAFLHSETILENVNSQLHLTYYVSSRHLSNSYTPSKAFSKQTGQPIAGISIVLSRTFSAIYTSTYLSNSSSSWQVLPEPFTPDSKLQRYSSPTTAQKRQSVVEISSFGLNAVSLVLRTVTETYSSKKDSNTISTRISSSYLSLFSKPLQDKTTEDSQTIHISTLSTLDVYDALSSSMSHDRAIFSANISNTREDSTVDNSKISSVYQSYSSTPTQLSPKASTMNGNLVKDSSSKVEHTGQHILRTSHTVPFLSSTILGNCCSQTDQGYHVTSLQTSLKASESQTSQRSHIAWRNHSNGITLHTLPTTASFEPHPDNLESSMRTKTLATKMDHGHTESVSTHVSVTSVTLPTSTNWKLYYNRTQESSIVRRQTRGIMAQSTGRTHSVSGYYHHNSSQRRCFLTAESTMQSTWRPNIDGESVSPTTTSYVKLTSFQSSVMLLPHSYNSVEASSIRRIQTQNSMLTLTTLGQFCQQAGSSPPPVVPPTQTSPLLFTKETIISPTQNQSKITWRYTINMSETILSNLNAMHSSSLNTPQNGVTLSSDVTRSSNHIFTLATKREILHSTEQSSEDVTRSSYQSFSLSTISKVSQSNFAFPSSDSQNTEMVYSSRTSATISKYSISGSHVGVSSSRSESYQVNPVLSWGRKTVETKTDPEHIETISISHTIATSTTSVCCEGSSVHWPRAMESSKHQANRESIHATEMLQMVTAQETSYFKVSFGRPAGSEMDNTEIKTSSSTQSPISTSQVSTTLSRLSITISPSRTAPSSPVVDSTTSTLTFPWHLIPFVIILLVIFVALVTYCLRVPDITEKIFLALKERKKQITRSRQEKTSDVMKGNVLKNFEASTFHSYQRELFYDATLNYAMFEQSTTRAIEFSIHLDEEDQSAGPEEAVEISCVLGDEPANGKQGGGSLSEMFDKQ